MNEPTLNWTLSESVLTLLIHNSIHGRLVANLVQPELFEGDYRLMAERAIEFWHDHGEPPRQHMDDLLSDILDDPQNRRAATFRRILTCTIQLSEHINTDFILDRLRGFIRRQKMKQVILDSAEQLQNDEKNGVENVEQIWNDLLRSREIEFEQGTRLGDVDKLINYMQTRSKEFSTGIEELDSRGIVPARSTVMLVIAGAKKGKSAFLIHLGKMAFLQRKRVLHISLEMSEEEVLQRYYQSLFSVPKRAGPITTMQLEKDAESLVFTDLEEREIKPEFTLASVALKDELNARLNWWGARINNIIIKRFPTRGITIDTLRAYLDSLEIVEKFIPDLLILDYIGIMKTDVKNHRLSLGRNFEEFRGLLVERHIAGVTAQQASREGVNSSYVSSTHVSEDWSLIGTADTAITYSATDAEARYGLGRLFVANCRNEEDRFGVLISQSYKLGQFCLTSALLDPHYFDCLERLKGYDESEAEDRAAQAEDEDY